MLAFCACLEHDGMHYGDSDFLIGLWFLRASDFPICHTPMTVFRTSIPGGRPKFEVLRNGTQGVYYFRQEYKYSGVSCRITPKVPVLIWVG